MGENSTISWTDHTFNPWIGCTKVSPACDGCYAEAMMDLRYGRVKWGGERVRTSKANWRKPIAWNKAAEAAGTRPRVFCASLADVFDNQVPPQWRADLFELIRITPNLTWLLLTKRPQNIVEMVKTSGAIAGNGTRYLPGNVALGTTIEDQRRADINVPALLEAKYNCGPAYVFVSCEPLLGPIDLRRICLLPQKPGSHRAGIHIDGLGGRYCESGLRYTGPWDISGPAPGPDAPAVVIDWVIAGGETDQGTHKARASHPDWFRSLRDQCATAGTIFHFKQWGEWAPSTPEAAAGNPRSGWRCLAGHPHVAKAAELYPEAGAAFVEHKGKRAGRLLDGEMHNAMPEILR